MRIASVFFVLANLICTNALTVQTTSSKFAHARLYTDAEILANTKHDSVILIDILSQKVAVGFPRCRISSIFQTTRDISGLITSVGDPALSFVDNVKMHLPRRVERLRAHCIETEPWTEKGPGKKEHFTQVSAHPIYTIAAISLTIVGLTIVGIGIGAIFGYVQRPRDREKDEPVPLRAMNPETSKYESRDLQWDDD